MHSSSQLPRWRYHLLAVLATAAAAGLRELLTPWLGAEVPLLLFALSTLVTASFGGFGPGVVATLLGALVGAVVFMPPRFSLALERGSDLARLAVFVGAGVFVSWGCAAMQDWRRRAAANARRAAELGEQAHAAAAARESASAALRDTRRDFMAVFDYAAVGMAQTDPISRQILRVNQKFCEMTGYSEDELLAMRIPDLTHPDDRKKDETAFRAVVDGKGTEFAREKRYLRKNGSVLWAYVSARVLRSSSGSARMTLAVVVDITERKRAERELQDRESQLRQIGDNLSQGFLYQLVAAPDGRRRFIFFSAGLERITGVPVREALADATSLYSLIHPDDARRIAEMEAACLAAGSPYDVVARTRHRATGEWRWAHIRSAPRAQPGGTTVWDGIFLDITGAKQTEEALAYSMERLNLAQRAGHIGVFDWQVQTGDLVWNDEEHRIFGLQPGSFAGKIDAWSERVHPDDLPQVRAALTAAMERREQELKFAFRIIRPDGAERALEGAGRFFYDGDGRAVRMVGVNFDVTERREAQARIEKSEAHLRAVVDAATASGVGIVRSDAEGRVFEANNAFFRIIGRTQNDVPANGFAWLGLDREKRGEALGAAAIHEAGDASHPLSFETEAIREDGSRVPLLLSGNHAPGSGDEFIWFVLDLSEQKKAELELRLAKEAAEAASSAKDHFLATLSHELRTPLAPVVPLVGHLIDHPKLPADAREDLRMIRRNIALETRLIDDLLDLTRVEKGKLELRPEVVDLHPLLERTRVICAPEAAASDRVTVELELNAQISLVWGDPVRLQQVFWNLLHNACKFSGLDGRIVIRTDMPDAENIRVEVQDFGRGISPELRARLFRPFEQGERESAEEQRGLGLGLAITKALVEAHHGRICVQSGGVGQGATFQVILPIRVESAQPQIAEHIRPADYLATPGPAKRILLVEDHVDTGVVMERLLKARGYVVERVTSKAGALAAGKASNFDVLVSDIGLPDGSGHEVMQELGRKMRLCGIALSGFGAHADLQRSREAGFAEHLVKPVDFDQLLSVLETHCPPRAAQPEED